MLQIPTLNNIYHRRGESGRIVVPIDRSRDLSKRSDLEQVIKEYRESPQNPIDYSWMRDDDLIDLFCNEFYKEVSKLPYEKLIVSSEIMFKIIGFYNSQNVIPDISVEDSSADVPNLTATQVSWDSEDEKIELAIRIALEKGSIPYPDGRKGLLLGESYTDNGLVSTFRRYCKENNLTLDYIAGAIAGRSYPEVAYGYNHLHNLGTWWHGIYWFHRSEQYTRIEEKLKADSRKKKVWDIGTYNGEELAGLVVHLKEKGIERSVQFVGTDLFAPDSSRIMYAGISTIDNSYGREALKRWFQIVAPYSCRPSQELIEQMELKQGDITISHEQDCDIILFNDVLHAIPYKKRWRALANAVAGLNPGGLLFTQNDAYEDKFRQFLVAQAIESYVFFHRKITFVERNSENASYVIMRKR